MIRRTCRILVVMGVSGCGKSSVGRRVAAARGWPFLEGDDMHSEANVAKMHAGMPLDDADRRPWLEAIGEWVDARLAANESGVVACSALKRRYREQLMRQRPEVCFAWLRVERQELERRVRGRADHFMPATLLDDQLATREPPAPDEPAFDVDANDSLEVTLQRLNKAWIDSGMAPP